MAGSPTARRSLALKKNPDILVATPGRLLDLMQQGYVSFEKVEMFVLDEADRMLDMGFIYDVRRITDRLPRERQTMFFSATLPPEVASLASDMLWEPARVACGAAGLRARGDDPESAIRVERRQTRSADRAIGIAENRASPGLYPDQAPRRPCRRPSHEEGSQGEPTPNRTRTPFEARHRRPGRRALAAFDTGKTRVLVATDIVARGIDVEGITPRYQLRDAE